MCLHGLVEVTQQSHPASLDLDIEAFAACHGDDCPARVLLDVAGGEIEQNSGCRPSAAQLQLAGLCPSCPRLLAGCDPMNCQECLLLGIGRAAPRVNCCLYRGKVFGRRKGAQ